MFGPGGAEVYFRPSGDYEVAGREVTFNGLQEAAAVRGEIALGLRIAAERDAPGGGVFLNPDRERRWGLTPEDEVVVLATCE